MKSAAIGSVQKVPTTNIPGNYKLLIHRYGLDHEAKEYAAPVDITLNADGSIAGSVTGTWTVTPGTSYITINIGRE